MKSTAYRIFLIAWLAAAGCGDAPEPEIPAPDPEPDPSVEQPSRFPPLEGTHWKLAGVVDASTGEMKKLDLEDCANCYTLTFDTDSSIQGRLIYNTFSMSFAEADRDPNTGFFLIETTLVDVPREEEISAYLGFKNGIRSYEYLVSWSPDTGMGKELQFYNEAKDYLLYEPVQP
jgi:hypothetical protein